MAALYKTDGTETTVQPQNGTNFRLQELYDLLSVDMIEIVPLEDGRIMICDEEARLKADQETNVTASLLFQKGREFSAREILSHYDEIIGPVLVCRDDEVR